MTSDNISRFPHSGSIRRSATSEHCGLSDAEIAAREAKFLSDWRSARARAATAIETETAAIIAATRKARVALIAAACRQDDRRQMEKVR